MRNPKEPDIYVNHRNCSDTLNSLCCGLPGSVDMTNPFTKFLNQWSNDTAFTDFIAHWDVLEQITVQLYRQQINLTEAEKDFRRVWPWLRANYGRWEMVLRPFWQNTKVGGQTTQTDPFLMLLALQNPADIPGNWPVMQHLPAAREALNQYLTSSEVQKA